MKWTKQIFVGLLCITTLYNDAVAADARCGNEIYRINHPDKCKDHKKSVASSLTLGIGAFALTGGALAAIAINAHDAPGTANAQSARNSWRPSYPAPKLGAARSDLLGDVDVETLNEIMSRDKYVLNRRQYDEIGVAFSLGRGYTGRGTTVAVMDTGTGYYHGRMVADFVGAVIASGATVESYQIAKTDSNFFSYAEIGEIFANAAKNADVMNNSWNISMSANDLKSREQIAALTDTRFIDSVSAAARGGSILVWAAGNDGAAQSGALSALPAVMSELRGRFINVVAWDSEQGRLADYSNACGITKEWCITAPGSDMSSGKLTFDGTSFAAPLVSAAIAVLKEAFPFLSPEQITELLFVTATDLGAPGVDEIYGHGMMDLERASRPVGTASIAAADGGVRPLTTTHVTGTIAQKINSADLKFAFFDGFGRPFEAKLADNISVRNRGIGITRLRDDASQSVRIGNLELGLSTDDFIAGDGFLQTDGKNITSFVAMNNEFDLGDVTMFQRAQFGAAKPRPAPDSIVAEFSPVYTASISIGARRGNWAISIGTPETIVGGDMTLRLATGRTANGTVTYQDHKIPIAAAPSIEYSLTYKFITAGFVDNPYGEDEFYMIAKSKLRF